VEVRWYAYVGGPKTSARPPVLSPIGPRAPNPPVSLDFFVLSRFQVLLSDGGLNALKKGFRKKIDKKSKTDFFFISFITFLGVSR
jgi:hypothetical protein